MMQPMSTPESAAAWHELLSAFADFDNLFLDGPKAVRGEAAVSEGYQNLATMLALSLDMTSSPTRWLRGSSTLTTPFRPDRRWGGDNTDCYYSYAVVDPRRTYRVSGAPNDSAMYSLTVYNEPEPGAWPNRTVGLLYDDRRCPWTTTAGSPCVLGPVRPDGLRRAVHRTVRRCTRDPHPRLPRASGDRPTRRLEHRGRSTTPDCR